MTLNLGQRRLKAHPNPIALIILMQLATLDTTANDRNRLLIKLDLFKRLFVHKGSAELLADLCRFLDMLMHLNHEFSLEFREKAKEIQEKFGMRVMADIEREGFQRGILEGKTKTERSMLKLLLQNKFKKVPQYYRQQIAQAESDTLLKWVECALNDQPLEEIFKA